MKHKALEKEINREKLAKDLLTWRLAAGYTQKEAAEKLGTSRYSIMRAEAGKWMGLKQTFTLVLKLAQLKAITIDVKEAVEML